MIKKKLKNNKFSVGGGRGTRALPEGRQCVVERGVCPGEEEKGGEGRGEDWGGRGRTIHGEDVGPGLYGAERSGSPLRPSAATPGENTQGRLYHTAQPNLLLDECGMPV